MIPILKAFINFNMKKKNSSNIINPDTDIKWPTNAQLGALLIIESEIIKLEKERQKIYDDIKKEK